MSGAKPMATGPPPSSGVAAAHGPGGQWGDET